MTERRILSEKNHAVLQIILDTLIKGEASDTESVELYREIKDQLIYTMWIHEEEEEKDDE